MPIKLPKGITQDRADELKVWAYKVWDSHWKKDAPISNSRAQFLQYVVRDYELLTPELMKKIERSVVKYTVYLEKKKQAGEKLVGVRTLSVWYNQSQYEDIDDEVDGHCSLDSGSKTYNNNKTCGHDGCQEKVHGASFRYCADHLPNPNIDRLREAYMKLGIDKSKGSMREQCMEIFARKRDKLFLDMDMENAS